MKIIKTFLFLMCAVVITPAQATTIYSQGWDGIVNGRTSNWDVNSNSEFSSVLDTFSLAPSISYATVNNIGWWGGFIDTSLNPSFNDFYIAIYKWPLISGDPLDLVYDSTDPVSVTPTSDAGVSFYSMDLTQAVDLFGGVEYLLLIQAEHDVNTNGSWLWAYDTTATGNSELIFDSIDVDTTVHGPGPYKDNTHDAAFVLNGTVPEPATIWLMMLALAGMVVVRRRSAAGECKLSA